MPDGERPLAVLWRRLDHPGFEHCTLDPRSGAPTLSGTVLSMPDDKPLRVDYAVRCTDAWRTVQALVDVRHGDEHTLIELERDEHGRWRRGGQLVPELDGCEDVDLSVTPSTNTLPIRRLSLAIGASRDVTAAWIRFPQCEIAPLPQRYTRIGERRYRYESLGGTFVAELEVDEHDLVLDYPPAWERVGRVGRMFEVRG